MGKLVLKKPVIKVNAVDLTTRISQVSLDLADDEVDMSTFGSQWKETGQGLSDATISLTFTQDFDAAKVDATLWPLKVESKKFLTIIKPTEAVVSETNPTFQMGGQLFGYSPLSGSVGELSTTDPTIKNVTQYGITRAKTAEEEATQKTNIENAMK